MTREITHADYKRLVAILEAAERHNDALDTILQVVAQIVGEDDPVTGHSADAVYCRPGMKADELLKKLGIRVRPRTPTPERNRPAKGTEGPPGDR